VILACDVLVIGAGIAGWTAALRAIEQGRDVLLIDKSPQELGNGNTLMTSGSFHAAGMSPRSNPLQLYRKVIKERVAYPELAKAWSNNCSRSLDWLISHGIEVAHTERPRLEPNSSVSLSPVYRKDVGTNILRKLRASFIKRGGNYAGNVEAIRLLVDRPGVVAGIVARSTEKCFEIKSKATILTTGGFSANKEMLVKYIGKHADECKLRGSSNNTGDGLNMALEIGAKAVNMSYFYGHLLSLRALYDDRFWPYPRLDNLVNEGILVNRSGNRFVDEGRGDVAIANELARNDDVKGACLVFDQEAWDGSRNEVQSITSTVPSPNPWLIENDGGLYKKETAEGLAKELAIDGTNLSRTIEDFNKASECGRFEGAPVRRTGKTRPLQCLLYGLKVVPGITFTMGGVLVNGQAQVLNLEEQTIQGLYAAGDVIGGLMGGYHGGYFGGLSQAVVTGMLAGENAPTSSNYLSD
jgi:fumarate reductase flavoprotein subunit